MGMNLEDCGNFLSPGEHRVRVKSCEIVPSKSGDKEAASYTFEDANGKTCRDRWWLTKAARFHLRKLSMSCNISQAEREDFIPQDLIGKILMITVIEDGDYTNVASHRQVTEDDAPADPETDYSSARPVQPPPSQQHIGQPDTTPIPEDVDDLDEIPF